MKLIIELARLWYQLDGEASGARTECISNVVNLRNTGHSNLLAPPAAPADEETAVTIGAKRPLAAGGWPQIGIRGRLELELLVVFSESVVSASWRSGS